MNRGITINHRVIAASAGSGKTFQLANRYIGLLLAGVSPERIVALTFSRKAAGEILDKILARMASAAASDGAADQLAGALQDAGYLPQGSTLGAGQVATLLRTLLDHLHVARIGTLDSFFVNVIRAFPFEFGLSGTMDIMDDHAAQIALSDVLERVLATKAGGAAGSDFLEQFKRATFGQEGRQFTERLIAFVKEYHRFFLEAPFPSMWGNRHDVWGRSYKWSTLSDDELLETTEKLRRAAVQAELTAARENRFLELADEMVAFNPGLEPTRQIGFFLGKVPEHLDTMETHGCAIVMGGRHPVELPVALAAPLAALMRHVVGRVLELQMTRTAGIGQLLAAFEATYEQQVRRLGRLTFQDIQYLLGSSVPGQTPVLSGLPDSDRLYIDYRLDGAFDHWLLDEFQDTSTVQWQALANLADEVLSVRDGQRTFFYVGDVKQAIYAWRYGDHTLFGRILGEVNQQDDVIEVQRLATSYRSSPVIMETVNRVFADLSDSGLQQSVVDEWQAVWQEHRAHHTTLSGRSEFWEVAAPKGTSKDIVADCRIALAIERLQAVQPWRRGLTSAVLVRTRGFGERVVQRLRQAGIPVAWDGDFGLLDSSAVRAFLALLRAAAHPGDSHSIIELAMGPAGQLFTDADGRFAVPGLTVLEWLARDGFEGACRHFETRLDRAGLLGAADARRLRQVAVAAALFDRSGQQRVLDFIDFVADYSLSEEGSPEAVRVMTIHKSKGLEFDLVVLPELEGQTGMGTVRKTGIHLSRDESVVRRPRWALLLPARDIVHADDTLSAELEALAHQNAYEALCLLYVALTRAARSLILIATQGKGTGTIYPATLLHNALAQDEPDSSLDLTSGDEEPVRANRLFQDGPRDWYAELAAAPELPTTSPTPAEPVPARRTRHPRRTPSGEEENIVQAGSLFAPSSLAALELGTAVHALFEEVAWDCDVAPDAVLAAARAKTVATEEVWTRALSQLQFSLQAPAVRTELSARPEHAELWREREFEALVDGHWVSGCFDRVQLALSPEGKPVSATILDYKTSRLDHPDALQAAIDHYRPQMHLYRQVLAQLIQLPIPQIATKLIFTRTGHVQPL